MMQVFWQLFLKKNKKKADSTAGPKQRCQIQKTKL